MAPPVLPALILLPLSTATPGRFSSHLPNAPSTFSVAGSCLEACRCRKEPWADDDLLTQNLLRRAEALHMDLHVVSCGCYSLASLL